MGGGEHAIVLGVGGWAGGGVAADWEGEAAGAVFICCFLGCVGDCPFLLFLRAVDYVCGDDSRACPFGGCAYLGHALRSHRGGSATLRYNADENFSGAAGAVCAVGSEGRIEQAGFVAPFGCGVGDGYVLKGRGRREGGDAGGGGGSEGGFERCRLVAAGGCGVGDGYVLREGQRGRGLFIERSKCAIWPFLNNSASECLRDRLDCKKRVWRRRKGRRKDQ